MKSPGEIRQKLKQLRFRYMKAYLERGLKKIPQNCAHQRVEGFEEKEIGLCSFKDSLWGVVVCDRETKEGLAHAAQCPHFTPVKSPEELKGEFEAFFLSATRGQIAYHYQDMAALMWVLESEGEEDE